MRLLFVASDKMEFQGMLARAEDVQVRALAADFSRSARIGGYEAMLVANGVGWENAANAVKAASAFSPDAIVSTGFCGGLDDSLGVGDVIVGTQVAGPERTFDCRPVEAPHAGTVASIRRIAQTASEKRKLRETGALAVEMEAAGVAACALEAGLPFYCVRAVTDLAGETLENDFNGALRADGHFATIFILRGALCRPTVRLPELLRLRRRCYRAAQALGDFFVGCRF